jgi:HEAT repeat protein
MYAAGSGDPRAIAPLAEIAVDAARGLLIRASAAEFLGRLLAAPGQRNDAALNALIRATTDSEAIVRARATGALARAGDRRVVPILAARLKDHARVVRVLAASGLLDLGVTALEGPAQRAFSAAQAEYATSLQTFPDSAANQLALGVLFARQGLYDAAITEWQQGRRLDPNDPRFEKLIAEAKQRRR